MVQERRKGKRIHKHFILSYFEKDHPEHRYELTQLKNIGHGGMCFVTSRQFAVGTKIGIELKTPYLAETTYLEGNVLESHEKVKSLIYETRLAFEFLDPEGEFLLAKLIEFFKNGENKNHAQD
ncbi:MAG: PilZ domain-containing protein [Candidatus Omnitrophica bacterium]|nr:PilZ domain-containing protein [Candidatus Omnitrophota bacterium]